MSESEKPEEPDPKIIVDTDWKEQVAREKEAAEHPETEPPEEIDADVGSDSDFRSDSDVGSAAEVGSAADVDSAAEVGSAADVDSDDELPSPPPASFDVLVSMLFTQAMSMLGQLPDPVTQKARINKSYAKHYIDTLDMLSAKTEGNRTEEESKILSEALHALRMTYVNVK